MKEDEAQTSLPNLEGLGKTSTGLLPCRCGRSAKIEEFFIEDFPEPWYVATCPVCPIKTYDQITATEAARIWNTSGATQPTGLVWQRSDLVEMIRSAAIRKDGVVYPCWAHCFSEIKRMNLDAPDDVMKFAEQGFVTSTGRFVDRKEALAIALAAGQIIHKHSPQDELMSEDLRDTQATASASALSQQGTAAGVGFNEPEPESAESPVEEKS